MGSDFIQWLKFQTGLEYFSFGSVVDVVLTVIVLIAIGFAVRSLLVRSGLDSIKISGNKVIRRGLTTRYYLGNCRDLYDFRVAGTKLDLSKLRKGVRLDFDMARKLFIPKLPDDHIEE